MSIYVVTRKTDGAEVYRYAAEAPVEWAGFEFANYDHTPAAEPVPVPVPAQSRRLSKLAFVGLLGDDFEKILNAAKQSVAVEKFVMMLMLATPDSDGTSVDLADRRVIDALKALETAQIIDAGRAAEILNG